MKIIIYTLILSIMIGCSYEPKKLNIASMKMDIEIIHEFSNGGYSISWNDTLCSRFANDKRFLEKRPRELYCYILNNNKDTLGYYRGLSSPRQWTYFQTEDNTDSTVYLYFSVGTNHFSTFLADQSKEYISEFNANIDERVVFKPIKIDINAALRKKKEIELINIKN